MMKCTDCGYFNRDDDTCEAFERNGIDCPSLPCEEYWIFTFGYGHEHAGKYVKIRGTYSMARKKMFEKYGDKWAFQYSEKNFESIPDTPWKEVELEVIE